VLRLNAHWQALMAEHFSAHVDAFAHDRLPSRALWPDLTFDLPQLQYPARLNCAAVLIDEAVREGHGGRIAIYDGSRRITYAELQAQANRIANLLCSMEIVPGHRVLLRGFNGATLVASWLAVMKVGAIAVTTMAMLRAGELSEIIRRAEVNFSLCDHRLVDELKRACPDGAPPIVCWGNGDLEGRTESVSGSFTNVETAAEDTCLLAFTSGTTGKPKATMHFHRDVIVMADIVGGLLLKTRPEDIFAGTPPLAFTFGLGALLAFPLRFRAATAFLESPTPETMLELVARRRATGLFTAPTFYRAMLQPLPRYDVSSLRLCVSAGEMLPKSTSDAWFAATGLRLIDGIGATEMTHIFISACGEEIRPGSVGRPLPGYQACLMDDEGRQLPLGSVGKLAVKGPTGCRYLADERQKQYVRNGWNLTGDIFRTDSDGYYWFHSRADDMIVSSGYNIAAHEVEQALLAHEAVKECAVIGVPNEDRGQIVKAFVVPFEGVAGTPALVSQLQEFVKQRIAPYKYPRELSFVETLPRTPTGKLQRFLLK
jgi:2-aminobenzoate-CoA ligase